MAIIKIDKDTIKEVTTIEKIIKISDFENRLKSIKESNKLHKEIETFYNSAPEEMKPFIMRMPEEDEKELEDNIKLYKEL